MPRLLPQGTIHQLRCTDFTVAMITPKFAHVLSERLVDTPAALMPEHHARCFFLHMKQIKCLGNLAMIALFGFFDTREVRLQAFLISPCCTVYALQHFIIGVATPVRSRQLHQLECFELAGARYMRSTT